MLSDLEYTALQSDLARRPKSGVVIPGSGGIRKKRWPFQGKGKRSGLRVIYYCVSGEKLLMLFIYSKAETDDLTAEQLNILKDVVGEELK